jgi:hypothetical protein
MEQRVALLAGALARREAVAEGDRVAYLGQNAPELLDLLFACADLSGLDDHRLDDGPRGAWRNAEATGAAFHETAGCARATPGSSTTTACCRSSIA